MLEQILRPIKHRFIGAPIVFVHEFHKPPYGGGNQFLLALKSQLEALGEEVGANHVGPATKTVLFNSFNFDFERLRKLPRSRLRMVHRVDGPIGVYRGTDNEVDIQISKINQETADITIFQSQYSLNKHCELHLSFKNPVVIPNAADPKIFHPAEKLSFSPSRKIKIIAAAWSDNPRKGAPVYQWLDENLDFDRYEFTFVGRMSASLKNARHIPAVGSQELAHLFRQHDVYITASQDDPCSNALIEALSCGLPAIYLNSGGHPELVKEGGLSFDNKEQIPDLLKKIQQNYFEFQKKVQPPLLEEVARQYLSLLK